MDSTVPPYSEAHFNQIKTETGTYIKEISFDLDTVPFLPLSSLNVRAYCAVVDAFLKFLAMSIESQYRGL